MLSRIFMVAWVSRLDVQTKIFLCFLELALNVTPTGSQTRSVRPIQINCRARQLVPLPIFQSILPPMFLLPGCAERQNQRRHKFPLVGERVMPGDLFFPGA